MILRDIVPYRIRSPRTVGLNMLEGNIGIKRKGGSRSTKGVKSDVLVM